MRLLITILALLCTACSGDAERGAEQISSVPLRGRTAGEGTRFARLDPAVTGLSFQNDLKKANNLPYLYSGAGVAIGDYDGDGLPDVYLVSQDGQNKLFRQVAPLRFEDVTEAAGGLGGGEAWGSAATFADVDGDADLDLYVCNTEAPNLLFQNNGDGTFTECAGKFGLAISASSTGASFADYDNDGDLDLYLLTNRVFGPLLPKEITDEVEYPADTTKTREQITPPFPRFQIRDGKPVVPADYKDFFFTLGNQLFSAGQRDRLFRNDGYADWHDVTDAAGIHDQGQGLSATWWDCDGDGWLDLYVANDLESPDQLYRNRGDGTFEDIASRALPHTAYFGMGGDFGDIDNDGRFDFCVADMSSTSHYMSKLLMGSMSDRRWFLLNADPKQYMRNAVYVNSGTERFLEAGYLTGLASTDWTWTVRFADLDDDGWLDFYATNGIPLFDNDPDVGTEFTRLWRLGERQRALDLMRELGPVAERNIAKRNAGDLRFDDVGAEWGLDELGVSHGAVIADLDRDGDLDIIVNNLNAPASLFENRTAGAHRILVQLRGTEANRFGVGSRITVKADGLRQTRLVMLSRGFMSAGEAVEHFGLGASDRVDRLVVRWPSGREQVFTDLEVDRLYTIREAEGDAAESDAAESHSPEQNPQPWFKTTSPISVRHVERPFDDYALQPLLPHQLSQLGPGLAWSDVDGDGRDDVWLGGAAGQAGTLMLALEDGKFRVIDGPWWGDRGCEDLGAVFFDFDSDGDLDLYVVSGSVECVDRPDLWQDRLYVNGGDARFTRAADGVVPEILTSGGCVCAADFDRDGDLDLFVGGRVIAGRYPEAPPSMILRNDGGKLIDATAEIAPSLRSAGMVTGAVWTDYDNDGWLDLIVVAQWHPVRVFSNRNGKLDDMTEAVGLGSTRGLWNSVAAADLDSDGDMDLVVTNLGLNTKYHADPAHPLRVFADDFDKDGQLDIVEAKYEGDALLPVRGRSCSSNAMPFIGKRFETFKSFALASLTEIYGATALEQSLELAVDELRHLVLENRDGSFIAHPLPRAAQIAPGYGIGIADFDGDGHLDVALAQNFYSPEPETGRFAGGLGIVLAGRGTMQLEPVAAHRSGIVMPEDAMALTITDLDGDAAPDFVCSTNNGPVRAFAAVRHSSPRAVRLVGRPGNPTAIGARLELVAADGSRQVREVRAGSGYLSQSAPLSFFSRVGDGSKLVVRWPDGSTVERSIGTGTGTITVTR